MLVRVLGVSADSLDEAVFNDLVSSSVVEYQRLEYKSQLPGTSQDERREIARDIAAIANGGGGVLVIGIEDDASDAADQITPVPLGSEITRLNQICNSLIEPYLHIHIHDVGIGGGPNGIIVIEIPSSQRRPFAVVEGSRLGYYRRTGRNRHPLTEAEVSQMYQARGTRLESASARLNALVARVPERLGADPPPAIYVAIAPLETYERLFRPDRETLAAIRALNTPPVFGTTGVGDVLLSDLRPGFKRVDLAHGYQEDAIQTYGWSEFHDDGAFLGVIVGREDLQRGHGDLQAERQATPGFYDTRLTCELVARLAAYGLLAVQFDVHGEIAITAGIADAGLPATITTGPERWEANHTQIVTAPVQTSLSADVEDLVLLQGVLEVGAPLLDDLLTAFGWPQCHQLDRDGTIRLGFWGGSWSHQVEDWAQSMDLPVARQE